MRQNQNLALKFGPKKTPTTGYSFPNLSMLEEAERVADKVRKGDKFPVGYINQRDAKYLADRARFDRMDKIEKVLIYGTLVSGLLITLFSIKFAVDKKGELDRAYAAIGDVNKAKEKMLDLPWAFGDKDAAAIRKSIDVGAALQVRIRQRGAFFDKDLRKEYREYISNEKVVNDKLMNTLLAKKRKLEAEKNAAGAKRYI